MIVAFGTGLYLGDSSQDYTFEIQSISGLDSPAIRNGNGVYSGEDGGYWISQYFGHRTVTIKGFSIVSCASEMNSVREYLLNKLPIRYVCPIAIEDTGGNYWYLEGVITDVKCDWDKFNVLQYQITVVCVDPLIYPAEDIESFAPIANTNSFTINASSVNYILPQTACYAFAVFNITGIYTTPLTITNSTTGDTIVVAHTTTSSSNLTEIDIKRRIVTVDGTTINDDIDAANTTWFKMQPGSNRIRVTSGSSSNTATVNISYSYGYKGI